MSSVVPLGRYVLDGRLAFGGMSEVFAAHIDGPEGFKRRLVIKRLLPDLADRQDVVRLFLNEARIAARFHHPNLIQVHELFEAQGQYCLAMELLEGVDAGIILSRLGSRRANLDPFVAAQIIADAAAGLHYAHELRDDRNEALGVVHRDVSPSNLFVTWQGVVKVVDFGIAKTHAPGVTPIASDALRGKLPYMSPEQIDARPLDRRSDIFSLGAVFYELLTGERAFDFEALGPAVETLRQAIVRPVQVVRYDVPDALAHILHRMLARDPADRYAIADEVSRVLSEVVRQLGPRDVGLKALVHELFQDGVATGGTRVPTAMIDAVPTSQDQPPPRQGKTEALSRTKGRRVWWAVGVVGVAVVAGLAMSEGRAPTADGRAPMADGRGPIADGRGPIADGRAPMADGRGPTADGRAPMADGRAPIADNRAPIADGPAPMADSRAPIADSRAPIADNRAPIADSRASPSPAPKRSKARPSAKLPTAKLYGLVVVNADPWADVYLEGKKLGTTPLPPTSLAEGVHVLELRNPDTKNQRVQVRVVAGKTAKVFTTMR